MGVIEKACDTPNILESGMLIVKEHMRYQKKRERTAIPPPDVIDANGIVNGEYATAESDDVSAYPSTA